MRPSNIIKGFLAFIFVLGGLSLFAQQPTINYFRPWNHDGVNMFEAPKDADASYDGLKVRIGGAFTQQYQSLKHENGNDTLALYPLGSGFNTAQANLNIDVQLGDGVRLALENYMSSRHHNEFWVKGGYIQFDKLPFFGNPEFWTKYMTAKIGHMEINYGDQHFRRTDNGNSFFNPFVGNAVMDAFATEIGGELYFKHPSGFLAMVGVTNGLIKGDIKDYGTVDHAKGIYTNGLSTYFKLAFDKKFNDDLRLRLSGSMYMNGNTTRNTLYGGDRAGSRYFLVMEAATANATDNAFSGRINPGFSNEITAIQVNAFVKFKGLELFGIYETASGLKKGETDKRKFGQYDVELSYRFLKNEQLVISGRYNSASGDMGFGNDVTVTRYAGALGWYLTKNLLFKVEYVNQTYTDFPVNDLRYQGKFNGLMVEAAVGF